MGDENPIRTLGDYSRPNQEGYRNTIELLDGNNVVNLFPNHALVSRTYFEPHHGIDLWLQVQIFYDHVNPAIRRTIDQSAVDDVKLVKAISLPHDVPNASDSRLIELENKIQRLMEAHLAPKPSVQVNKIASSCEICSGSHDTQYCKENP
ncbi:hypothetical protein Tco_0859319 [Tanacetum coccineum]|uniref:MAK10-like protein n=1 Tax=Tanacetum coccineum TaxID=301880 RepID=A0ABQ5BEM3_9ASTR